MRRGDVGDLKDRMYREMGKLFMETVMLRQALGEEQAELVRMATELGSLRKRHERLSATALEQEQNLTALNIRLMGKAAPTEIKYG